MVSGETLLTPGEITRYRNRLGRVGVWLPAMTLNSTPADVERRQLARLEQAGYLSIWFGEYIGGREIFSHMGSALAATGQAIIGSGIANLWSRHPAAMSAGGATLAEFFEGRVALGVGVSTPLLVERYGLDFGSPAKRVHDYLAGMEAEAEQRPVTVSFPRLLGCLGPKMMKLAREQADGAHPYLVPVQHTAQARDLLGSGKLLAPEVAVVLGSDDAAKAAARGYVEPGLRLPRSAYLANLKRLGYAQADLDGADSQRLVDDLVAVGGEQVIHDRVCPHLQAGADTVLVQALGAGLEAIVGQLERLAPALL